MLRSSREGGQLKDFVFKHDLPTKLRLLYLYRKTQRYINLLVDVQGYQILVDGIFNGDPHPGNLLAMKDGSLGLVDFGQTKTITDDDRLGVARVVSAIGKESSVSDIADAMRSLGFQTKFNDDDVLAQYAALFFDSDIEGHKMGYATPQVYFSVLTKTDPLVKVPDVASKLYYGRSQV
jgi:aarF domain-containing kinase